MHTSLISPHNLALNPHTFQLPNRINNRNQNGVEMITLHTSINYTSLKDLMPPPPAASPTFCRGDSWREIPIKDPLLQLAAWAYLRPMTKPRPRDDDRWWRRFRRRFWWLFGCFNDAVLVVVEGLFSEQVRETLMIKC